MGGSSSEREISLKSAAAVKEWITPLFDEISVYDFSAELPRFLNEYKKIDVVIPVFHGRGGEDGTVQGFLQTLGIPFIFSGVGAHALGMEKAWTKSVMACEGVRTATWKTIRRGDMVSFECPSVVKVPDAGSSVGVFLVKDEAMFAEALEKAFAMSETILIEDFIVGREFTVPIVEIDGEAQALPVIEIKSKNAFFDLESKYDPNLADEICPAEIGVELAQRLQDAALKAHLAIGARDLSRSDFMVDEQGRVWFLEINTIPGMTRASLLPKAVKVAGLEMGELFRGWIGRVMR